MPTWLMLILIGFLSILLVLILDATVLRWRLRRKKTFSTLSSRGLSTPDDPHLLVYLPGIMADGITSIAEIRESLQEQYTRVLSVSYGAWRFLPEEVVSSTAKAIGRRGMRYNRVTLLGASMGGLVATQVINTLRTEYNWSPESIRLILVDTPPSPKCFTKGEQSLARVARLLYAGPILNRIVDPMIRKGLVLPKDSNIEYGLDAAKVKRLAGERLSVSHLSRSCDEQRYMARVKIDWRCLNGVRVIFLACTRDNVTVQYRRAWFTFEALADRYGWNISMTEVDSTHCGFLERQQTWRRAFQNATAALRA